MGRERDYGAAAPIEGGPTFLRWMERRFAVIQVERRTGALVLERILGDLRQLSCGYQGRYMLTAVLPSARLVLMY
jgi:hypothetical protein